MALPVLRVLVDLVYLETCNKIFLGYKLNVYMSAIG